MPTQVIVQSELKKDSNAVLRIISNHAREEDVRRFIEQTRSLSDADDKRNADAVYDVSMRANSGLYEKLWRDPEMCTAFKELFKDEIREAERNGQAKLGALIAKLIESGRTEEILRASTDEAYRERLYAEYRMA